jgi:two-component system sensor histidine kinase UhpB
MRLPSRRILITIILNSVFFISAAGQGQQVIDSLQESLNHHLQKDTTRAKLLLDLVTNLMSTDIDKCKKVIDEQINLSDSLNYKYGLAFGYLRLSYYYAIKNNDSLFVINLLKCQHYADQINDKYILGVVLLNLGTRQMLQLGNSDSALYYFNASLPKFDGEDARSEEMRGQLLSNVGSIYFERGDYKKALDYYLQAKTNLEKSKFSSYLSFIYSNLSIIYSDELKNNKAAIEYAAKALKVSEESNNKIGIAQGHDRLGALETDNQKASTHYRQSLQIYQSIGDSSGIANELNAIGRTFQYSGSPNNYDSALYYFEKSLSYCNNDPGLIMESNEFMGFGFFKKRNYADAIKHYLIALDISKKIKNTRAGKDIMEGMIKVYAASKNYLKAYEYSQSYSLIKDSLLDAEKVKSLNEMSSKYESLQKENEIILLNKDKKIQHIEIKKQTLQKNILLGGLALVFVLFLILYNNYRTRQKLKLENLRNNIAADLHDDIGSTLNSISIFSEVAKHEAGKAIPALDQIGVSARKIIDAMSDIVWTINPENDSFENVIARMRSLAYLLLKAKAIEYTFKADEMLNQLSLPMAVRKNVYLLFKEATNNLVKYSSASSASFHLSLENKNVKLIIHDNGLGFEIEQVQLGNGIKNMRRRAAEMGACLVIHSGEGKGTKIELSFKS